MFPKNTVSLFSCFLAVALLSDSFVQVSAAGANDVYSVAKQKYAKGKYQEAADSLRLAIYKGTNTAAVWLLLGQSYFKQGEMGAARQALQTVKKYFPSTAEAAVAGQWLVWMPVPKNSAGSVGAAQTATASPQKEPNLMERILVIEPKFSHPPVSSHMMWLVRSTVSRLPATVFKVLDQAGLKIYVTPNLMDRFPDAVNTPHPVIPGGYLTDELGRCYGKELYIYERTTRHGGTALGEPEPDADIKAMLCNLLAHAYNDALELPSKDEQFLTMYRQDIAAWPPTLLSDNPNLCMYTDPKHGADEVFACLTSIMFGSAAGSHKNMERIFPRCRAWILRKIQQAVPVSRN